MTKAQIRKLEAIIGRLEALQNEVADRSNDLGQAKTLLINALRKAER